MKFTLTMAMSLLFASSVSLADHHENQPNAAGGSIYFQTDDPAAYIALLKSDEKLFKASGAVQRGVCFNSTGMTESGRGWTYAFYPNMESALAGSDALVDPKNQDMIRKYQAVSNFRGSVHYTVIRPHPRSLASATARAIAVQVDDVAAYLGALETMEAKGKAKGLDVAFSAYTPMGAGPLFSGANGTVSYVADVLVHFDAPTSGELGKFFDLMSSTDMGSDFYDTVAKLDRKLVMDQIVRCMNTNSAM